MNGRLLSELKAQRSVNELVNYFGMLTREVNKIYAAKISADKKAQAIVGGDDAGADELTEILDEMLKPELVKLTPEKLQDYIVRAYMTQIYFQVKADQLQKQMDGKNSNRKFFDECESIKKCLGCAAAVLALLVDNKIS
ncbi:MAG: hypothetical protein JO149_03455, partial [Gammaproteobacteria bacterium]|nr:hypothetical protein [Gammaproteobacteria bacterium]